MNTGLIKLCRRTSASSPLFTLKCSGGRLISDTRLQTSMHRIIIPLSSPRFLLLLAGLHIAGGQTSNGRWRLSSSSVTLHNRPAGGFTSAGQAMTSGRLQSNYSSTAGQWYYVTLGRHLVIYLLHRSSTRGQTSNGRWRLSSSSVTLHNRPAGGFTSAGQQMTSCCLQSNYSSTAGQ